MGALEQRVEARARREHIQRLKMKAKDRRQEAYKAKMESAKLLNEGVPSKDARKADMKASLALDRSRAADEAVKAALGESAQPFHPKKMDVRKDVRELTKAKKKPKKLKKPKYTGISKGVAEKLATKNAKRAEKRLSYSLLTCNGLGKAAVAAKVALAYEKTADNIPDHKLKRAKARVKRAKAAADQAMRTAIKKGRHGDYMKLRRTMNESEDAETKMQALEFKRRMRLKAKKELSVDPSLMVAKQLERRASKKYYKNVKRAENAYAHAASRRSKVLMGHAAMLGASEK